MLDYGLFSYASKQEVLDKSIRYWNPGKTRGVGTKVIYATPAGIWFGSDGRRFAGQIHDSIAFTPLP